MKLAHGLAHFGINPQGQVVADIGASTGGFTDVLLQHGAEKVYAVDVGYGQLADKLRKDARVVVMEKTNARHLTAELIPDPLDAIVCDASFISLKTVLPAAMALICSPLEGEQTSVSESWGGGSNPTGCLLPHRTSQGSFSAALPQGEGTIGRGWLLALIKPQFEVGREEVGNGIITDSALHQRVCADISEWLNAQPGWQVQGITPSPILGPKGNTEFLIYGVKNPAS